MKNNELIEIFKRPAPQSIADVLRMEHNFPYSSDIATLEWHSGFQIESLPAALRQPFLVNRLNQLIGIMRVNPVWKKRLDQSGIDTIRTLDDWSRVPITTRNDMREMYTTSKSGLVIPWNESLDTVGHKLIASGGSSGEPVITSYRATELDQIGQMAGQFWRRNMLSTTEPNPVYLNLFIQMNGWASHELVQNLLEGTGGNTLPVGSLTLPRIADFYLNQGVTDIVGLPHNYADLTKMIKDEYPGKQYPEVKRGIYGGEFMDPSIRDALPSVFPNLDLVSVYSSTQACHLAAQINGEPNLRITDWINYLEIVDDQSKPVKDGTPGRILVTRLTGYGDQPLRFEIGDRGVITTPDAKDPVQARKLTLMGRGDDKIRLGSADIWDLHAEDLIQSSHAVLKERFGNKLQQVQMRQVVVTDNGIELKIVVPEPANFELTAQESYELMRRSITNAVDFFEDPTWPENIKLSISFVNSPENLEKTPAGKIHPYADTRIKPKL